MVLLGIALNAMTNVCSLCLVAEVKPGGGKATGPSKSTNLSH